MGISSAEHRDPAATSPGGPAPRRRRGWRVIDIVVLAVLAAVCAVVFWAWSNLVYPLVTGASVAYPPVSGLILGGWLIAGPLAGLILRRPGAALACELLAAVLEAVAGTTFGVTTIISGIVQGLGAELAFALLGYRRWGLGAAVLSGLLSGLFGTVGENILWNYEWPFAQQAVYTVLGALSGVVIAGVAMWALVRGLRGTGVLDALAGGR